jgi:FkbM family methyltransferase
MSTLLRLRLSQFLCGPLPPIVAQRLRSLIYPKEVAYRDDYTYTRPAATGSPYEGRTSDLHGYSFAVHGYHDWRNWVVALASCHPGDTIVEVGGNVGTETIGFSDIVGPQGRVITYEPVASNVAALQNLAKRCPNVQVRPSAVGMVNGRAQFVESPVASDSGVGHALGREEVPLGNIIEVNVVTLDSQDVGEPSALFVDAEGAEVEILRGAIGLLSRVRPVVVLEASHKLLKRAGYDLPILTQELGRCDYLPFRIGRLSLHPANASDRQHANWVCLPRERSADAAAISRSLLLCGILPMIRGLNPMTRVAQSPTGD